MSYETEKLMNLEDGQLLLSVLDKRKADIISVSDTTPEAVKTFPDGADGMPMGLTVGIEPVQDLHGYENPWPAGGNVNTLDPDSLISSLSLAYGFSLVRNGEWITLSGTYNGTTSGVQFRFINKTDLSDFPDNYRGYPDSSSSTYMSGLIRKADSNTTLTISLRNLVQNTSYTIKFRIMGYTGSSAPAEYSPYSNICPISGWTEAEVTRTGKNLLDPSAKVWQSPTNMYFYNANGITLPAGTYTLSFKGSNAISGIYALEHFSRAAIRLAYNAKSVTFTLTEKTCIDFTFYDVNNNLSDDMSLYLLEYGSTASEYEAYQGEKYSISFPSEAGTVYGGTLTVNSDGTGTLVVDRAYREYTGASGENWNYEYTSNLKNFYIAVSDAKAGQAKPNVISNCYKAADNIALQRDRVHISNAKNLNVATGDTLGIDNVSDWKTYLASHNLQVVYFLATPQTYTLSALEVIETLKGINVLFADTGNIEAVSYACDTRLFIEKKIAELQALILENISNS